MSQSVLKSFTAELEQLNEKYRQLLNAPTRSINMLQMALLVTDGFKVSVHPNNEVLTEGEFLQLAKEAYWKTRQQLQAGPGLAQRAEGPTPAPVEEQPVQKKCENCCNRCMDMDMDPYCAAVNKPYGRMLYSGRPPECGDDFKLWERDPR